LKVDLGIEVLNQQRRDMGLPKGFREGYAAHVLHASQLAFYGYCA